MAVIVSILGIITTLALSIHERTRELGMLRAVGMSRRQVRRMVRYEAVITAMIGAMLGMVLGIVFAVLVTRPLADEGFTLGYPIGSLWCCSCWRRSPACSPRSCPPGGRQARRPRGRWRMSDGVTGSGASSSGPAIPMR